MASDGGAGSTDRVHNDHGELHVQVLDSPVIRPLAAVSRRSGALRPSVGRRTASHRRRLDVVFGEVGNILG